MLHKPTTNYYKIATDEFRTVAKIQIDPSRCRSFLDKFGGDPGTLEERKALLDKFEIDLRPGSTDHDVFLQVRRVAPSHSVPCFGSSALGVHTTVGTCGCIATRAFLWSPEQRARVRCAPAERALPCVKYCST